MKHFSLFAFLTLAACSSGGSSGTGTTGGGPPQDAGSLTITFTTVDIHPAAKAALMAAGAPIPSLLSPGPADAGYKLIIQGVSLGSGAGCNDNVCLNLIATTPITSSSVYSYTINIGTLNSSAPLGVLAGISPQLPDGGTDSAPSTGLPQLPCAAVEGDGGVAAALAAAAGQGLVDYFFPSGSQVGGLASPPPESVSDAAAYAIPMSYASILNCAGNAAKTKNDSDTGVALVYVTDGDAPTAGNPVSGASVALQGVSGASSEPPAVYYTGGNYAATASVSTDSTGIATYTGINVVSAPPTLKATDSASDTFFSPGIDTAPNSFFSTFVYKQ